jgi:hypothetical protein
MACTLTCHACEFHDNVFHAVLLNHSCDAAVRRFTQCNVFSGRSRGDIARCYNPMADTYSGVLKDGEEVELSGDQSTTGLVQPSW